MLVKLVNFVYADDSTVGEDKTISMLLLCCASDKNWVGQLSKPFLVGVVTCYHLAIIRIAV